MRRRRRWGISTGSPNPRRGARREPPVAATRIGFVGLGVMGAPMAGHLLAAGYPLTVHDIDETALRGFVAAHPAASAAPTPQALASQADIVITMLPNGEAVERVALGEAGLLGGLARGTLLLDTSSSEPWLTVRGHVGRAHGIEDHDHDIRRIGRCLALRHGGA